MQNFRSCAKTCLVQNGSWCVVLCSWFCHVSCRKRHVLQRSEYLESSMTTLGSLGFWVQRAVEVRLRDVKGLYFDWEGDLTPSQKEESSTQNLRNISKASQSISKPKATKHCLSFETSITVLPAIKTIQIGKKRRVASRQRGLPVSGAPFLQD